MKVKSTDGSIIDQGDRFTFTMKGFPAADDNIFKDFPESFTQELIDHISAFFLGYKSKENKWVATIYFNIEDMLLFKLPGDMLRPEVFRYFEPLILLLELRQEKECGHVH